MFKDWAEYRDYLLENVCSPKNKALFIKSFGKDMETDDLVLLKAQVKTILLNDICLTVYGNAKQSSKREKIIKDWDKFNKKYRSIKK